MLAGYCQKINLKRKNEIDIFRFLEKSTAKLKDKGDIF